MYKNSYSSVLVNGLLTRFFRLFVGVKQGACSSPDLYVIFVNQLAIKLEKMNIGLSIYGIWLGLLLFCDDMVILANSREEMEKMIQIIKDHCRDWPYSLAIEKTKIMTISVPFKSEKFYINGILIEEVSNYRYLGGILNRNLKDSTHWKEIHSKVLSAANRTSFLGVGNFSINTVSLLFNSLIASTAIYGSQIFIPSKSLCESLDRIMRKYFKKSLRLAVGSHSSVFYGELLELDFIHRFSISALLYFHYLFNSDSNTVISRVFHKVSFCCSRRKVEIDSKLRICYLEFIYSRISHYSISLDVLKNSTKKQWNSYVKKKVKEIASKEWSISFSQSRLLSYDYKLVKSKPLAELYLKSSDSYVSRIIFKLRIGTNALYGCQLRYQNIERKDRLCPLCEISVEDSLHFCSQCPILEPERNEFRSNLLSTTLKLSPQDKITARCALLMISDVDLMRLLLCCGSMLSFSNWKRFYFWFNKISQDIFKFSFNAIFRMYSRRLQLVYPEGLNSNL
jgi:hypothetical protein